MVIIVLGLPGSGKSFFASRLAEKIGATYINSDRLRKEMYKVPTYSKQEKENVYNEMLVKMKEAVQEKKSIVLDATFHKKETRNIFLDEMKEKGDIFFIEVQADENIIRQRLKKERPYSDADFEIYQLLRKKNEPLQVPHLILQSTDDNIDMMLKQAAGYLKIEQ